MLIKYSTARQRVLRYREAVGFAVVGTINTGISYGTYVLALHVMSYPIAFTISYVVGISLSYVLNSIVVFREHMSFSRAVRYPLVYIVQYILGMVLLFLLVHVLSMSEFLAPFVIVAVTIPITFVLSRRIIKRPDR